VYSGNSAKYFGGVFYINSSDDIDITIKNSEFLYNNAGIAGGVIFFENITPQVINMKDIFLNLENTLNNTILNNNAISHGNNFATHPTKFVQKLHDNDIHKIFSGGSISLMLELHDEYDNIVYDQENYYSNIGIKAELYDLNKSIIKDNYIVKENGNIFNNGIFFIYLFI